MKEVDAKLKWCHRDPTPERAWLCMGSGCAVWDPDYRRVEKRVEGKDPPDGTDEWMHLQTRREVKERESMKTTTVFANYSYWVKYVPTDTGDCGLKSKELECGQ